ncbi:tetratricopeptide repeat protein [Winogradskyella sediminis]|uniref:tetratricopeptide repeat protein n=1 Tax=Winogradskyella sediminis TaxID=1382466 RepID=UPI003AA83B83
MKERRLYISLILVLIVPLFSFASLSYPQSQKIDSILEQSSQLVYDNPNESIDLALSVYESAEYTANTKVKALMLLSLAYTSKRNYQKALEYIKKADELSKPLEDNKLQIEILFKIGILYQQLKIFDKSIEYLEKTEQMALLYPDRKAVSRYIANSYAVKGFIYKDNLNCDIALEFFDRSIAEYHNVNNGEINTNLSIVYYNKGNCYTLLSEYGKAKNSFNRAIALAELSQAKSLIAFAKKGLAAVFTEQGEYQSAIDYLNEALEQSKNVGDIVLNSSIYNGLLENHLALNQWEAYQKYYELYSKSQLEIKIAERNSVSDSLEDNEIRKNQYQAELQNQTSNRLKVVILLLIFILVSVFFIEKKNRKTIGLLQKRIKTLQNQKTDD